MEFWKQVRRCSKITWPREPWAADISETTQNWSMIVFLPCDLIQNLQKSSKIEPSKNSLDSWGPFGNLLITFNESPKIPLRIAREPPKKLQLTSWDPVENFYFENPLRTFLRTTKNLMKIYRELPENPQRLLSISWEILFFHKFNSNLVTCWTAASSRGQKITLTR